jgi:E1A/CREB-binding protein
MEGKTEYICPKCCLKEMKSEEYMPSTKAAIFGAKDLPRTILSDFIEERLFRRLNQEREERAKFMGMNIDEVSSQMQIFTRILCFYVPCCA